MKNIGSKYKYISEKYRYTFKIIGETTKAYVIVVDNNLFNLKKDELSKCKKI